MQNSKIVWGGILIAIVIAVGIFLTSVNGISNSIKQIADSTTSRDINLGAEGTRMPNGISTDSTSPSGGEVRTTTLTVTGAAALSSTLSVNGLVTTNAGILRSYTNSTSTTATSQTLALADFNGYDTILLTPNTGDLTLTFFASSTASTWLPTAGDMQETCLVNSTTTAGIDITFAAGTGIDLETASSSPTDLTILSGNTACFKFIRQKSTASAFDISALMTEYTNGD